MFRAGFLGLWNFPSYCIQKRPECFGKQTLFSSQEKGSRGVERERSDKAIVNSWTAYVSCLPLHTDTGPGAFTCY